jgi:hypothetical protein
MTVLLFPSVPPGAERSEKCVSGFRCKRLLGQCSGESDRVPHLSKVDGATVTGGEMGVEATPVVLGQRSFEIVGHETHELAAGELVGLGGSVPGSAESHRVSK